MTVHGREWQNTSRAIIGRNDVADWLRGLIEVKLLHFADSLKNRESRTVFLSRVHLGIARQFFEDLELITLCIIQVSFEYLLNGESFSNQRFPTK
jgi:hypothetical protein